MSNGVRQTGKSCFSFLFAVYFNGLLVELIKSGVDIHCGISFAGALSYSDDVVLLAPCSSENHVKYSQLFCSLP